MRGIQKSLHKLYAGHSKELSHGATDVSKEQCRGVSKEQSVRHYDMKKEDSVRF